MQRVTCIYTHLFLCTLTHSITHMHACMHICIHVYAHIHTCTHNPRQQTHLPDQRKALNINIVLDGMKKVDPKDPKQTRRVHMYVISQGGRSRGGRSRGGGGQEQGGRGGGQMFRHFSSCTFVSPGQSAPLPPFYWISYPSLSVMFRIKLVYSYDVCRNAVTVLYLHVTDCCPFTYVYIQQWVFLH